MAAKKTTKAAQAVVETENSEKKRALEMALAGIEKQFGKGSIIRMGDRPVQNIEVIPTGCLDLDMALGVGGLPRGRVIEIYGPESSGKTTVALHVVAEAQRAGGVAAFIDAEHALDPVYAKKLGVDMSRAKLKTLASAMMSNLAQSTLSVVGGIAVSSLLSMTGFGNVLSSVIMAGVDYAVVKVGGILYMKLISGLTGNGRDPGNMSDDELRICLKQVIECEDLQRMMSESKKEYAKGRKNGTITGHERVSTIEMER